MPNRKKPTKMKLVEGTARKDRMSNEPDPQIVSELKPPSWLTAKGKTAFREMVDLLGTKGLSVLANSDRMGLALLCDQYAKYRDYDSYLKKNGETFSTFNDNAEEIPKARPQVAMRNVALKELRGLLSEFGLTPSARAKLNIEGDGKKSLLTKYLSGM